MTALLEVRRARRFGAAASACQGALVPVLDSVALFTPALASGIGPPALIFASLAFLTIRGSGQERAIHPRVSADLHFLLSRFGISLLISGLISAPFVGDIGVGSLLRVSLVCSGSAIIARAVSYGLLVVLRRRGLIVEKVALVGTGGQMIRFVRSIQLHPEFGLVPVGFLDTEAAGDLPLPVLGEPTDLESVVNDLGIRRIVVAPGETPDRELEPMVFDPLDVAAEVHIIPRRPEVARLARTPQTEEVWGVLLVRMRSAIDRRRSTRAKRLFDLVAGSLLLCLASPVIGIAALAVRLSGPGPIFINQKRVGKDGEIFTLIKLRTMTVNDEGDTRWTVEDDPRVTSVGRTLRRLSLDELPQLVNVLRGDMSLVGPRPERPYFADRFRTTIPEYEGRLRVTPGITGWAQVNGLRGDTSINDRSMFDNLYIERWSLWEDVVILMRTVAQLLRPGRSHSPLGEGL